ncbi:MAG: hypothetical protein WD607_08405 [Candidatus Paceibacterota bacterium]
MKHLKKDRILTILPGSSDIACNKHKKRYDLIVNHAKKIGYQEISIITYPGQHSHDSMTSKLSFKSSVSQGVKILTKMETKKVSYDIVCLSYGCNILLEVLNKVELNFVRRISLWGPTPKIVFFNLLVKNKKTIFRKALGDLKVRYSENLYEEIPGFEIQLADYSRPHKIYMSTGTDDTYSTPEYFNFLFSLFKKEKRFHFIEPINGLGHSVSVENDTYLKFLFGDN